MHRLAFSVLIGIANKWWQSVCLAMVYDLDCWTFQDPVMYKSTHLLLINVDSTYVLLVVVRCIVGSHLITKVLFLL